MKYRGRMSTIESVLLVGGFCQNLLQKSTHFRFVIFDHLIPAFRFTSFSLLETKACLPFARLHFDTVTGFLQNRTASRESNIWTRTICELMPFYLASKMERFMMQIMRHWICEENTNRFGVGKQRKFCVASTFDAPDYGIIRKFSSHHY